MAYAYNAEMICDACAAKIKDELDENGIEDTGDTNDYPQSDCGNDEADCPQHCADCSEFLENGLTSEGYAYVREAIREHHATGRGDAAILRTWGEFYDIPFDLEDDDDQ